MLKLRTTGLEDLVYYLALSSWKLLLLNKNSLLIAFTVHLELCYLQMLLLYPSFTGEETEAQRSIFPRSFS